MKHLKYIVVADVLDHTPIASFTEIYLAREHCIKLVNGNPNHKYMILVVKEIFSASLTHHHEIV